MDDATIGAITGFAQTIVGHPLDTLKVWKQNSVCKNITIFKLYSGITYPTINHVCVGYFLFGSNDYFYKLSKNHFLSGFISGSIISIPIHISEYFKINEQLQKKNPTSHLVPFCHTGFVSTFCRECIGSSVYFGGYHSLRSYDISPFLSGGISGIASWLFTYPIDVVKTRVKTFPHVLSYNDAVRMGKLWNGIGYCLIRGFVVNGTVFFIYDLLSMKNEC